jgi:hypothetical protein
MPYSAVPKITLNEDDTITLEVNVKGFNVGTPVEISGQATQTNGAVAAFYSVQEMTANSGQGTVLTVGPIPAAPGPAFAAGFPITVVARAAEAWITILEADPTGGSGNPQAQTASGDPQTQAVSGDSQPQAVSGTSKAAWKENYANWAVAWPGQTSPATTLIRRGTWGGRVKRDPLDAAMGGLPVGRMGLIGRRTMSDVQLELAYSLPSGFRFGEVSSATALRDCVSWVPSLGPLTVFTGTFHGSGFNTIFRPDLGSPTPLPIPATGESLLELNLTQETLSFWPALGCVPNRGEVQPDAFLNGVPYLQVIQDVTVPSQPVGIHFEPGLWMSMPKTTDPNVRQPTVFRMASIPHGTTIEAQGTFSTIKGKPDIKPVDITPFPIGQPGNRIRFPSQKVVNKDTPRVPQDLTSFAAAGTITQAMLDDPNTLLRNHIASQNITSTTVIRISTRPAAPLFGGGTRNIAFLLGDPQSTSPNAKAVEMDAVFWIETVEYTFEVPIFQPGQPPLIIPAETGSAGQPVPEFLVNPPISITAPRQIKVPATQIQYSQHVLLNFNDHSWPHVSVATLVPATPIPVLPSAWASLTQGSPPDWP